MVTERAEDLKTVMADNATFIQLPPLGSSTSLITVYGDNRVNIQRTIRSIMQLVSLSRRHSIVSYPIPARLASSMSAPFGSCQSNSMPSCLRLSTRQRSTHSFNKSRWHLVQKLSSRACVLRCTVSNTKFGRPSIWLWSWIS